MKLGANYLKYNPLPAEEKIGPVALAWRRALATLTTFTPGDDLSHYNTVNNWFVKQTEMKFSVLKIGEGNSPNADSKLFEFAASAKASGTQVMGYWFFRSHTPGETQWNYCLAIVDQLAAFLGYKPFIWADAETNDGVANSVRIARLGMFLTGANNWNPGRVGVYSSPGFANTYLTPVPSYINTVKHWIAHWTSAALPTSPNGWSTAQRVLWQIGYWDAFSWCPPVPGCAPDIDRNKFFGDEAALTALTGANPPPTLEQRVTALEALAHSH